MSSRKSYEDKIAALLRKAEDPAATPKEAQAYTEKAEHLMIKWGISDAIIEAKRSGQAGHSAEKIVERRLHITGYFCRGEIHLGFAAGRGLGKVRVLKANGRGSSTEQYLYFIGFESDVSRVISLFESLRMQVTAARTAWWKNYTDKDYMTNNQQFLAKRQFIMSFASEVERRLVAMRTTEEEKVEPGTALVLVDRSAKVDDWMSENYPRLGHGRQINRSSAGASEGRAAGRNANLGGSEVTTGRSGAIGQKA